MWPSGCCLVKCHAWRECFGGMDDMNKKTLNDIWINNKKAFVRVDYNVPMDKAGNITNDTRIRATLPTLNISYHVMLR